MDREVLMVLKVNHLWETVLTVHWLLSLHPLIFQNQYLIFI